MRMEYELHLYDRSLLSFRFENGFCRTAKILDYDENAFPLFPLGLELTDDGLYSWLNARLLPINRTHCDKLSAALGLACYDIEALYQMGLGLSLTDSYWIAPKGFDANFEEVNLFENGFAKEIAEVAFTGATVPLGSLHGLSPDLVTDGTLPKAWRIGPKAKRLLYKGASCNSYPGEPLSEFLASQVGNALGIDVVRYDLEEWGASHPALCSVCPAFTTKDVSYTPFSVATGSSNVTALFAYAASFGDEEFEKICSMLVFDALVCNTDRHWANFGFPRDNHTGELLSFAPIFDNGRSLFFCTPDEQLGELDEIESQLSSATNKSSFIELAASVIGPTQHEQLQKLSSFEFQRDDFGALNENRCKVLGDFVKRRAEGFCALRTVDHNALKEQASAKYEESKRRKALIFRGRPVKMAERAKL